MVQGTTPTHTFKLPFTVDNVKDVIISYIQNRTIVFVKKIDDCVLVDNEIQVNLTQEDTFSLSCLSDADIEFKVLTSDNKVVGKKFKKIEVEESINKEVFPL